MNRTLAVVMIAFLLLISLISGLYFTFVAQVSPYPQDLATEIFYNNVTGVAGGLVAAVIVILVLERY